MRKFQKHIKHPIAFLSILLSFGVMATGAHAKDVTSYALGLSHTSAAALETVKKAESVSSNFQSGAKVTADLHNHIEKQTLSSMVKSLSDDTTRQGSRQLKREAKKIKKLIEEEEYIEPDTTSYRELFQRALGLA